MSWFKRRAKEHRKRIKGAGRAVAPYKAKAMPYVSAVAVGVGAGVATYYGGAALGGLVTAGGTAAAYQGGSYWGATAARADGERGREARAEGRKTARKAAYGAAIGGAVGTLSVYGYQGVQTGQWGVLGSQAGAAEAAAYPTVEAGSLTGTAGAAGGSNSATAASATGLTTKDVAAGLGTVGKLGVDYYNQQQAAKAAGAPLGGFGDFGGGAGAGAGGGSDTPGGGENPLDALLGGLFGTPKGGAPGGIPPVVKLAAAGALLYLVLR